MAKTRSGTVSASSSSAQKPLCSSSSVAPRKNKRKRTVSMPERKKKLRRQKALQQQIAIAKASQPVVTKESGKRTPKIKLKSDSKKPSLSSNASHSASPNAACKNYTRKNINSGIHSPPAHVRHQASRKRAAATVEEDIAERNSNPKAVCKNFTRKNFKSGIDSPAAHLSHQASRKRAEEDIKPSQRKNKSTKGKRSHDIFRQGSLKKVRTSESSEACTTVHNCDQVVEANHDKVWTSEQDEALQNAYFQVRPSSNFWFEVSRKVLGKTAKDCFDRFYSAHPTPPTMQPRSRGRAAESPVRSISFPSPMPSSKSKARFGRGKQGLLRAHQAVRHILRQQRVADGTYEADVFPAVEQLNSRKSVLQDCTNRVISPLSAFEGRESFESPIATPANCFRDAKSANELRWSVSSKQKLQSGHDQNSTISSIQSRLLSPEVLKAERNPGRLDRFLDILHLRRLAKRKTSSLKGISQNSSTVPNSLKAERTFTKSVAAAREAIITDAKEALKTVMQQKSTVEEESSLLSDHLEEDSSLLSDNEIL